MSQNNQSQSAGANSPPPFSTGPPPPIGYPTSDPSDGSVAPVKAETNSKGDGFFKGCLAAMCCCCCLDMCF